MTSQVVTSPPVAARAPSLRRRMACFVYEGLMLFGIGLLPGAIGALFLALTGHAHPLQSDAALRVIAFVIYGIYFTWFWSRRGQTLPMQTWHIRVVTIDGQPLSQTRALLRYLVSCIWFAPAAVLASLNHWARWDALAAIGVGVIAYALLALLQPQRQFWHDVVCGTQLVDAPLLPRHKR
ncbi:MAG: RDD family protein [Rhizobacter sp.]|nr:RDD family protein [Rhizobacter sp.]